MTSDELDLFERSVIAAGRAGAEPSELQRSRVRHGLALKLAAGTVVLSVGSTAAAMVMKIGASIALAGALAAGGYYAAWHRKEPRVPPSQTVPTVQPHAPKEPIEAPAPAAPPTPAPAIEPRVTRRPSPAPAATKTALPDLGSELALLSDAKSAIERGEARRAGEILGVYDRTFRHGLLAEERMATGVFYLCAMGRVDSARAEAKRFVERFPHSPLRQRVEHSCISEARR